MKLTQSLALGAVLALAVGSASAFNFGDAAKLANQAGGGSQSSANNLSLINSLSSLNVTPKQALGGTGALLGLAQNQLSGSDYSALTSTVPGLEQMTGSNALNQLSGLSGLLGKSTGQTAVSGETEALLGNVQNMGDVQQAFAGLGMDSGLVSQFAPVLLQYLGNQGVGGSLLQSLASVWGVGAN